MSLKNIFFHKLKFRMFLKKYLKTMRDRKKFKNIISIIKFDIFDLENDCKKYFTNKLFVNLPVDFSIFFNQYNFLKLIRVEKINFYLLKAKKFYYPLTNEQIVYLKKNGFNINPLIASLLFFISSLKEFFIGFLYFFTINLNFFKNLIIFKKKGIKELFIHNLSKDQILSFDKSLDNLEGWIKKKFNLNNHILVHNNKNCKNKHKFSRLFLPDLYSISEFLKFNLLFLKCLSLVLIDLLFFRIKQLFIFPEIVKLCSALSKEKNLNEQSFFFFNEQPFFRPLYTYALGNNVFYVENYFRINTIYLKDEKKEKQIFWKNLTWSRYVVWNEAHKSFIKKNQIINAKYYIMGPISFGTEKLENINNKFEKSVLVFDAIPFRRSYISVYNTYSETFHEKNILKFLGDICDLSDDISLHIKPKRTQYLNIFSKKYNQYLKNNKKFNILNPEYSPQDIIKQFDKIICLPFSTTAWIAKKMNKKVCYYDVVGLHKDFGNIINEIPIIRNFSELQKWVQD